MSLGNCKVYRATMLETFLSKFLPYHLPFINKRKRVRIRNYFRYAYKRRLMIDMTNALKEIYDKDPFEPIQLGKWNEEDYSWEVIPETFSDEKDGIKKPFYGIVSFETFTNFYSK